jgi:cyanate permease
VLRSPPLCIFLAGVIAAFGVGKLPGVLPTIQSDLSISLVQASLLVGMFQLSGAIVGVFAGAMADRFGPRRQMQIGLLLICVGSLAGVLADTSALLLTSRCIESLGFILTVLPGPSLLRRSLPPEKQNRWLGIWAAYMPTGAALGLIIAPVFDSYASWRIVWLLHCALCIVSVWLLMRVEQDRKLSPGSANHFWPLLAETVRSAGPWMIAGSFGAYAGQYLSIIAFLPTIYQEVGIAAGSAGLMTALVAWVNVFGNIGAGQLIHRGVNPSVLIAVAAICLIVGAWLVYGSTLPFWWRYVVVLSVSAVMGLIPGSLFVLAANHAPRPEAVSTTVGLMQQGSALGQLILPVLVGWVATQSAGWHNTWLATGLFAAMNLLLAALLHRKQPAERN